jgi:phosphatidylglycerophosphate synthase
MRRSLPAFLLVQGVTISRITAAILIGAVAQRAGAPIIWALYTFALATDFLDGFLARKLSVSSNLGHVLDLIADRCLTVVSLLYAASLGVHLLPLLVIALRDLTMLGMRAVHHENGPLLPTNRWFGALLLTGLAVTTASLAVISDPQLRSDVAGLYWAWAVLALVNLSWRMFIMVRKLSRGNWERLWSS